MATAVVIAATRAEAAGAGMRIAGLSVVGRAVRQLALLPHLTAVVASDAQAARVALAAARRITTLSLYCGSMAQAATVAEQFRQSTNPS